MVSSKALIFAQVPNGAPVAGKDLTIQSSDVDIDSAPANGVVVKNLYASFDPYMRGRMRDASKKSYSPPFTLGEAITSAGIARVLKSSTDQFAEGDTIVGSLPVQQYSRLGAEQLGMVKKLQNPHGIDDIKNFLGSLGMPGLTAYSSFYDIGVPKKGETIFISAASGAVGQLVGQLAKHEGLKVIGSVGSDEKLKYIKETLDFDEAFNYKTEKAADALPRLAPQGIDIYYENVGGEQLEAALNNMNTFGRIVACGMVSQYNKTADEAYGVRSVMQIVARRLTIRGFIVSDENMGPRYAKEHQEKVGAWIKDGSFKSLIHVTDGIDNAAEGFIGMLNGDNFGKAVLKIQDE